MSSNAKRDRQAIVILAIICAAAFAIRIYRAGDPFGGFHSFNEGWYSVIALNYRTHSLLFPITIFGTPDYNVVPFYSYLLYAALRLFGDHEITFRSVSIIFSVLTLPFLYLIGKRFYGRRAGLFSAALYAFCPISVVVGRNVQTDPVYLCFLFICLHLYLKGASDKRPGMLAWSGFFFGLSFFTKQFAVLLIPALAAWELVRGRGFRTLNRGHIYFGACAALIPAPFFIYHILTRAGQIVKAQAFLSASQLHELALFDFRQMFNEIYWGMSPLIFVLCFFSIFHALRRRRAGDILLLISTVVFLIFFTFFHGHSYYQLYGTPFLCLLGGAMAAELRPKWISTPAVPVLCALAAIQAVALLCVIKYGYDEFPRIASIIGDRPNTTLILGEDISGNYRPDVHYYCRNVRIIPERELVADPKTKKPMKTITLPSDGPVYLISFLGRPAAQTPQRKAIIHRRTFALVLFGRQVLLYVPQEHYFSIDEVHLPRVGPWTDTGIRELPPTNSFLLSVPEPGSTHPVSGEKMIFSSDGKP